MTALLRRGTALALAMEKWRRSGLWILSRSDAAYPKRLKRKLGQAAPPLLYGAGNPSLLENGGVAIVGSRDVPQAGLEFAQELAHCCVGHGLGVVSGGAKGVMLLRDVHAVRLAALSSAFSPPDDSGPVSIARTGRP